MVADNTNNGNQKLDGSHSAGGDTAESIIHEIAGALGVPDSDPSVMQTYQELVIAQQAKDEAEHDAENAQIFHDAIVLGRRIDDLPMMIGNKEVHNFTEFVPGSSGEPSIRTGFEERNPDGSILRVTHYAAPGHLPDGIVETIIKNGVETVTKVAWWAADSIDLKVGDERTAAPPTSTNAGLAPSTWDPKSDGSYGSTTSHHDQHDSAIIGGYVPDWANPSQSASNSPSSNDSQHDPAPTDIKDATPSLDHPQDAAPGDTSESGHTTLHMGGSNTECPTDGTWQPGACTEAQTLTPPTQVEVIAPSSDNGNSNLGDDSNPGGADSVDCNHESVINPDVDKQDNLTDSGDGDNGDSGWDAIFNFFGSPSGDNSGPGDGGGSDVDSRKDHRPATLRVCFHALQLTKRIERANRNQFEAHEVGCPSGSFSSMSRAAAGSVTFSMNTTPLRSCCELPLIDLAI